MKTKMKQTFISALFFSFLYILESCHANDSLNNTNGNDTFLYDEYTGMDKQLHEFVDKIIEGALPFLLEAKEHVNISFSCQTQVFKIMKGVRKLEMWALSFLDASGKIVDGLLSGNTHMIGNYDQCLRSVAVSKNKMVEFQGRYCLIHYKPFLPDPETIPSAKIRLGKVMQAARNVSEIISFYLIKSAYFSSFHSDKYGLCIPSGCSTEEIDQLARYFGRKIHLNATVHYCHVEEDVSYFTRRKIIIICIFVLLGLLAVIGTVLDYVERLKGMKLTDPAVRILLCFSITKNFPKIINTKVSDASLSCMNGIRVLTISYIIFAHHISASNLFYLSMNILPFIEGLKGLFSQIIQNGYLSVDVFFFISGFLNAYTRIRMKNSGQMTPSFIWLIIHRLWRIYPAYIFAILISFLLTGRGPISQDLEVKYLENCATEWWKNLAFINNFYDQGKMCILHSWYLSCDTQLFLLSLVTVPLLMNNSKRGIIVNSAVIIIGLLFTTVWCFVNNLPPTFVFNKPEKSELLAVAYSYNAPYTHAAPYFAGIILGYILATKKDIKISKVHQLIGWPVAGLCFTSMLFMTHRWNTLEMDYTRIGAALYFAFSRLLYVVGPAWIIFCSSMGRGGIINYILSLKIWIPLSRISFMMYLLSFILQLFYRSNVRAVEDSHNMIIIWHYLGDLTVTCLLSLVTVVMVESPFIALQKIVFSSQFSKKEELPLQNGKAIESRMTIENGITIINGKSIENCGDTVQDIGKEEDPQTRL